MGLERLSQKENKKTRKMMSLLKHKVHCGGQRKKKQKKVNQTRMVNKYSSTYPELHIHIHTNNNPPTYLP